MRAIRSRGWVAKELIRELTLAELGCKGQAITASVLYGLTKWEEFDQRSGLN